MGFFEQPPSQQWAMLKYRGEKFAEAWFKPADQPRSLVFRIPQQVFHTSAMARQLTIENLLKTVAIQPAEIESWSCGTVTHAGMNGSNPEFKTILAPPPQAAHLEIQVWLNPPPEVISAAPDAADAIPQTAERAEQSSAALSPAMWQDLEARFKAILGIEAVMDTLRISMEGLAKDLDASFKKSLTMEEKVHALRADVGRWEQAKKRIPFALPKMKDFIHRSVWALGLPERKRLDEVYKDHIQPQIPFAGVDDVLRLLEELLKARQVLSAKGNTVYQECKGISAEVQSALRTLQSNAADNAKKKRDAGKGGRFFKEVRKWSGG